MYSSIIQRSSPQPWTEVNGQLHAPAAAEKRNLLPLRGIEPQSAGCRAHSPSLYRLR
jgi:hypothetical protein